MDWFKQAQDMFKVWTDSQQSMWESMKKTSQDLSEQPSKVWGKTVQAWENAVKNLIDTQALWARMWARGASTDETTQGFVKTVEEMTHMWSQMQQQLWSNWFQMIRQFNLDDMNESMKLEATKAMKSWQENMQKMMDTQMEWVKQWSEMLKHGSDKK